MLRVCDRRLAVRPRPHAGAGKMMPDEKNQDNRLDAMIRTSLASCLDSSGAGCPDADLLAAFAENTLAPDERAKWNAHFAGCAMCQRQLATLARVGTIGPTSAVLESQGADVETVDADEAREEAGGFWPAVRSAIRFMIGPFPLSVALHVALLLVLIITIHEQRGRELIMVNLEAAAAAVAATRCRISTCPRCRCPTRRRSRWSSRPRSTPLKPSVWPMTMCARPGAAVSASDAAAAWARATATASARASAASSANSGARAW